VPEPFLNFTAAAVVQTATLRGGAIVRRWPNLGSAGLGYSCVPDEAQPQQGAVTYVARDAGGVPYLRFQRASCAINGPAVWSTTGTGDGWAVMVVVRLPAEQAAGAQPLFSPSSRKPGGSGGALVVASGEPSRAGNGKPSCSAGDHMGDGRWHVLTAVATGSGTAIYKDGARVCSSASQGSSVITTNVSFIGRLPSAAPPAGLLSGDVRQVAAWLQPLTAAELQQIHRDAVARWG
jgi:hypothetical protein